MKKSDLNLDMLLKIGDGRLVAITCEDGKLVLISEECLKKGYAGVIDVCDLHDDLTYADTSYSIMCITKLRSQGFAIYHILNNIEPAHWDWIRKEPRRMTIQEIQKELGYKIKIVE